MYKLNKSQKEAVEYNDGPLLIVAGAGTGKTTVVTQKITHLIDFEKVRPEEILALTFTDKAAAEMQERVDEMLEIGYVDLQISTFHAFCQRLLEEYGVDLGLPPHFKLLSQTDAWLLMRENIYDFNLDYYRPMGNPTGQIHTLLSHFSKAKDELITSEEYLDYVEGLKLDKDEAEIQEKSRQTEIANAYHKYNQLLLDNQALDFGDLIFYCVKLLQERPNILKQLQERFKYILVDEFQDVNWAQYQLIRLLTGDNSKLTVVGDDDQSIYAFRGSNVSIIMRFKEDYKNAKEIVLTENYRSGQEILDLAYKSILNNNPERLEEKLGLNKKLESKIKTKGKVEHLHYSTLDQEVQGVVKKISEIREKESVDWDDFAILVRANSHVEPFLNTLESSDIPYEYLASSGLYRQPVVLDGINFLKILEHIHDDRAWYRLLRMPFLKFTENDIQKITASAKKKSISYYEVLKRSKEFYISPEGNTIAKNLIAWIHDGMKRVRFEKPTAVLYGFMESSGYFAYLTHEENQGNREVIRQIYHLKQLFDLIANYERAIPGAHVAGFVDHYNYIIESGDGGKMYQPTDTPDSVNIITIHGAKGLEYKYVFIVNCVEERFPTRRRGGDIELPDELVKEPLPESNDVHYAEERRLFYVAATRAKEHLFFSSADDYGGVRKKKISRFLDELGFETEANESKKENIEYGIKNIEKNKETIDGEFEYITPSKFSFSQLNSYQRCPYQYKLAHILKIPMKGSAAFSFGNTIHNTLQAFYERVQELNNVKQASLFGMPTEKPNETKSNGVKVPKIEELFEMYEDKWIGDWYKSKKQRESYYKKGKDILKLFYASQEDNWTVPVSLEGFFKIKVGDYLINGRIDRIDIQEDGTLEIIDYKTGKGKEKLSTDDKQQLLIYQIAAQTLPEYRNIGEVGKLTFYYVNNDLKTSFVGKDKDMEKLQEKLLGVMKNIHDGKFTATPGKHVCKYCDFKEICEFRQL
ncbi:ATP-dependent helicase [Candidatus Parcubacteria bacterium]|jgi:DNA helicase II / ATP-dependent DNA helicase PcrA|nr:ATP-dependent helicase [Candidatus Parcubacteria bacterium]